MKQTIFYALAAACAVCLAANFGVTEGLGAHPRWALNVALIGAVPGIVMAGLLSVIPRWGVYVALGDVILAFGVAWWGKRMFVASSGDDAFAGQLWFYGWIAVCACAVAVLALIVRGRRRTSGG